MVTRYEHNPAIWGWEFGNELNLQVDLPNETTLNPDYQPSWELTHAQMWNVYQQFVSLVRQYDPYHIIEAGNSFPSSSSYHNMVDHNWTTDTPAQWAYMLTMDNSAFDMISGHAYGSTALEDINAAMAVSQQEHKALFVGEFGVPGTQAESQALFQEMLNTLVADKVPLAAVWAFDETGQTSAAGDSSYYSITPTNARSFMLGLIEAANAADGNPVPEPTALGLFGLGAALGLLLLKRRRGAVIGSG
jgi:endo-1,4-beta-mannosidase